MMFPMGRETTGPGNELPMERFSRFGSVFFSSRITSVGKTSLLETQRDLGFFFVSCLAVQSAGKDAPFS